VAQGLLPALDRVVLLHRFVTEFPGGKHRAHHDPGLLAGRHEGQDRLEGVGVVAGLAVQQRDPLRRDDLGPGDPLLVVGPVRPVHHEVPLPADVELEGPRRRREPFRSPPPRQVPDLRERLEHQLPGGADHPGDHDLAVRGRLRRLAAATARRHPVVPPALPCFRFRAYSSSRSKVSFQNRSKPPTHSWTGRSPRASRPYSRCLPAPRTRTSPTSRSTRRCLDACGWVIPRSRARPVTGRSPTPSSTRIPRRRGSARALNPPEVAAARPMAPSYAYIGMRQPPPGRITGRAVRRMTGWNGQAGARPLQGPPPILCEQPDGTALPQPDRPVTNVMPRNSWVAGWHSHGGFRVAVGDLSGCGTARRAARVTGDQRCGAPGCLAAPGPRTWARPVPGGPVLCSGPARRWRARRERNVC